MRDAAERRRFVAAQQHRSDNNRCTCEGLIIRRGRRRNRQQQQQQHQKSRQSGVMAPSAENVLDVAGVYHSTAVLPNDSVNCGCFTARTEPTAVLRDVSARVYGSEVLAVLGSKGSGKRALLDVIAGRTARGETRGRITLNGSLLTPELFRRHGAYVSHRCYLLPSLTVRQTLTYATWLANLGNRDSRVRQTLADLALSQVANRPVSDLTKPEYRRLMLGVQLAKDPLLLLLDEPTWDTDPLNTYLIVSMLWSYATRKSSIVVLTMETPRSDVLPFVARVTLLCLGAVVYSGPTRSMLDYFSIVGFPCPELENPLMYYLCLSTVDRRSRERFIESNQQISVLVDKFKAEGGVVLKEAPISGLGVKETPTSSLTPTPIGMSHKSLQNRGINPGCFSTLLALYARSLAATFACNKSGVCHFGSRIFLLPFVLSLLSVLYSHSKEQQSMVFLQTSGLMFNVLVLFYVAGIAVTALLFPGFRARYYQEKREGLYGGAMFITSYTLLTLPLSFLSTIMSVGILVPILELDVVSWIKVSGVLWASFVATEQLTVAALMLIKRPVAAAITVLYVVLVTLVIASGSLRSLRMLPDWLSAVSTALPNRYASLALNQLAIEMDNFKNLNYNDTITCPGIPDLCRYKDGNAYLRERFTKEAENISQVLNVELNLLISLAFSVGLIILNSVLYLLPLPATVKAKFRE
ncbi:ATP-binding cassette sub-family G member 5 [Phymastichus coffea]|uniref:ATP-binding cassette sub-family G member 5 n=1 Tax=Phymastichus coffea TaxID=108790 RepID=UPI00273C9B3A|nr:ATP-binding cassette sub-family G member 5 [Phymastichus coffea]XP_058792757.1 ATP-binding cassette sub-family G member 5 [Phymastichus coffea]